MKPLCMLLAVVLLPAAALGKACPEDLPWLRSLVEDGALAHHAGKQVFLTELATGKTELLGTGAWAELSPDASKVAWVEGETAKGRMRKGDKTVHTIARDIDPAGNVHWVSNEAVVVLGKDRKWRQVNLDGTSEEVPKLTRLNNRPGRECDVKRRPDGHWVITAAREWASTDGGKGATGGTCSCSLSPDGSMVTGLHGGHKECSLTPTTKGGKGGKLLWKYDGGFDNHRWSSNDARFIVAVDEKANTMAVIHVPTGRATRMGDRGKGKPGEMYGDFAVGKGEGRPWPRPKAQVAAGGKATWSGEGGERTVFAWTNDRGSNVIKGAGGKDLVCDFEAEGLARIGVFHDLQPAGGVFRAEGEAVARAGEAIRKAGAFTLQMMITADGKAPKAGTVLTLVDGKRATLTLQQRGDALVLLGAEGKGETVLGKLPEGRPVHVALAADKEDMQVYFDGKPVRLRKPPQVPAGGITAMTVGGTDGSAWHGRAEGVALAAGALSPEVLAADARAYHGRITGRKAPPRTVIEAELIAGNDFPEPDVYPQTLVVYRYGVRKVLEGRSDAREVLVAHRGILNGRIQGPIHDLKKGQRVQLTLEPFDAHPELQTLQRVEAGGDDVAALDLFYAAEMVPAGGGKKAGK